MSKNAVRAKSNYVKIAISGGGQPLSDILALLGCRSPLIVDYVETCLRNQKVFLGISCSPDTRIRPDANLIEIDTYRSNSFRHAFLPCAFGPRRRRELSDIGTNMGCTVAETLIDQTAILPSGIRIGAGGFLNAGTVFGGECFLGKAVVVNRAASVGHHCLISDFVSIGPGVTIAGNVRIESFAVIGAGATILPDIRIGHGAIIAAGSVVRHHVPHDTLVAGNPAQEKNYDVTKGALNLAGEE